MEANEYRSSSQEIVIFGKRIPVGSENIRQGGESHNENGGSSKRKYSKSQMPRLSWTTDLHHNFIRALQRLGGPEKASPKPIADLMGVEGLTLPQIKSHLQMYRNTTKVDKNKAGNPRLKRYNISGGSSYYSQPQVHQSQRTFFNNSLQAMNRQCLLVRPHLGCLDHHSRMSIGSDVLSHLTRWGSARGEATHMNRDSMVITSDKFEEKEEAVSSLSLPFSSKMNKGCPKFTTNTDGKTPSSDIVLDLTL